MAGFGKRQKVEQEQVDDLTGITTKQIAIAFGVFALLGAVFFTPLLDNSAGRIAGLSGSILPGAVDDTVTGSVDRPRRSKNYIIRRSVLNPNPSKPCYIYEDGSREGSC